MSLRILVAGGSQGIGFAMASGLAGSGHRVAVLSRSAPPTGAGLVHLPGDVREPDGFRAAAGPWLDADGGALDGFVYSAVAYGSDGRRPLVECTLDEWNAALDVNARGLFLALQAVVPRLVAAGGTIVGVSSDIATLPGPGRIPYAASKAAAHAVIAGLAAELSGSGVRVLEVMPTLQVDTPGIRRRRPAGFVPDGYADARSFAVAAPRLFGPAVAAHHGACLLVDPDGRLLGRDGGRVG